MNSSDLVSDVASRSDPAQLWQYYGSSSAFASALSGTTDKKSLPYKAALRNVQRWIKGTRTPSKATQEKLKQLRPAPHKIKLDGTIAVNGQGKKYERKRSVEIAIDDDEWERLQELAEAGDEDGFLEELGGAYGVDFIDLVDGTVDIE